MASSPPVIALLVLVQVVNGVLLPVTLFFVWRLASDRELMGEYANRPLFDAIAGATVILTSGSFCFCSALRSPASSASE